MISGEEKRTRRGLLLISDKRRPNFLVLGARPEAIARLLESKIEGCKLLSWNMREDGEERKDRGTNSDNRRILYQEKEGQWTQP